VPKSPKKPSTPPKATPKKNVVKTKSVKAVKPKVQPRLRSSNGRFVKEAAKPARTVRKAAMIPGKDPIKKPVVVSRRDYKATDIKRTVDKQGRTKSVSAQVRYAPGKGTGKSATANLSPREKKAAGYKGRVDVKGHLLAARLGGTGKRGFIFPQNSKVNNGMWKGQERKVAANVRLYGPATVKTTLAYAGTNPRPASVSCTVSRSNGRGCGPSGALTFRANNPTTIAGGIKANEKYKKENQRG
jgi:hypothetical protein